MQRVVFLDSSVLLNILDVPHKNGERSVVVPKFLALAKSGTALMVIPMAAVIEVGNHIAQLPGADRRDRATRLADILRQSLTGTPPWVVSGTTWDADFLEHLLQGRHPHRPGMVDLCSTGMGTGDGSILLELERYRQRSDVPSGLPVELWSLDTALDAYGHQ